MTPVQHIPSYFYHSLASIYSVVDIEWHPNHRRWTVGLSLIFVCCLKNTILFLFSSIPSPKRWDFILEDREWKRKTFLLLCLRLRYISPLCYLQTTYLQTGRVRITGHFEIWTGRSVILFNSVGKSFIPTYSTQNKL